MGVQLAGFPGLPAHVQTVTLGGEQYRIRFAWFPRLEAWYMDVANLDESSIIKGVRLSPKWSPLVGIRPPNDKPDGIFYVRGVDGYRREWLGSELVVTFYAASEVPAADAPDDAVVVSLVAS
jgi:hypothetical protein